MSKILVVDDEKDVCDFIQNYFRKRKIDAVIANSGSQALVMFTSCKPDLVLLDIKMPGLDGLHVLESIKKDVPEAKVMMLSGEENEETINRAKQLGAIDFIRKPLELKELAKVVSLLLGENS
ncbi:MAG: response regulator [Candidatus Gygaella obscura]|nr:response regulator [Candidatus Gygaella obscura]